jgi:hypothetical protein
MGKRMIDGLDRVLEGSGQPGLPELRGLLEELLGGPSAEGSVLEHSVLQPRSMRVFRVRFDVSGEMRTWIVKRLRPAIAQRNELVAKRWLPTVGLAGLGPSLAGRVADRDGACVWHVYEDLGPHELDPYRSSREGVRAAIEQIAELHTRFAGHALLGEARLHGGDLGMHFFESNVQDAIYALEACGANGQHQSARERLLERLYKLREHLPEREQALKEWGGVETLLHGDLWAINVFLVPGEEGPRVRLIDWDHAAVGPFSYDLSTFLLRFPAARRQSILEHYREAVARMGGWQLPGLAELNFLFETAEYARFANRVIWPAIALLMDKADWAFEVLSEIDQWFEQFEPVLPRATAGAPEAPPLAPIAASTHPAIALRAEGTE